MQGKNLEPIYTRKNKKKSKNTEVEVLFIRGKQF